MEKEEIKGRLEKIVGPRNVSDSEVVRESYKYMPFSGITWRIAHDFIVLPETAEQVSEIVKIANECNLAVAPRGGLGWGGFKGGILLDLTLMNKILKIDMEKSKAITEGGCSLFKLAYELFKKGLIIPATEYGPAPTVAASVQNPLVAFGKTRYGLNSELLEGLEVVLPTGEIVRIGSLAYEHTEFGSYTKHITGPDLTGLFIRHGGALGIITKVAYRCLRRPEKWAFHSYSWSRNTAAELTKAAKELTLREVFDIHICDRRKTIAIEEAGLIPKLPEDCWFTLYIIVTAENDEELRGKEKWIDEVCKSFGGKYMEYNITKFHWEWPTFFHPVAHPIMKEMHRRSEYGFLYVPESIYYPLAKFPEVYDQMEEIGRGCGFTEDKWQFAQDGFVMNDLTMCSQWWIWGHPYNKEERRRMAKVHHESGALFGAKGGTWQNSFPPFVSDWAWKNQPDAHELIKRIKVLLDPNNILMPGNIF